MAGQRNAIDGRIVEIAAELDRDELCGSTGARSVAALVAWKLGLSSANAHTITTVAGRLEEFPRCVAAMAEGRLSLDQVGVIAARAGAGSDQHYAQLAAVATVNQLRTAVKLEPRPATRSSAWAAALDQQNLQRRVQLLADHPSALGCGEVRRGLGVSSGCADRRMETRPRRSGDARAAQISRRRCRAPSRRLSGWLRPAGMSRRPAARMGSTPRWWPTSMLPSSAAALHLGPLLSDAERRYLSCDATCEVWFHRDGQVIGAGRASRLINRRLRRALEHRQPSLRGSRLWRHPRSARPPHPALGRRRCHRVSQPGAGMPLSPPGPSPRRHHHHRTRRPTRRHRQLRPTTKPRITRTPTHPTPARGGAIPRAHRRTRRLVVV